MSKPINACVLGVGLSGMTFHIPFVLALPKLFTLHSVLERNPSTPQGKVHERFGVSARIHRTMEDVLADKEVELIIIGTPNETHYPFAKAALEAGKHVLVDKPVTNTTVEGKELDALAKSKNLVLYPFQNRRWDSDFLALRKLMELPSSSPQSLGNLVEFESHMDRFSNGLNGWRDQPAPGAGQAYDLGAHLLDQTLTLFGRPAKLTAFLQNIRGIGSPDVDDMFTMYLQYPAGRPFPNPFTAILRGHLVSVRSSQVRFIVRGTKGTYTKFGVDGQEDQLIALADPGDIFKEGYGMEPESLWGKLDNTPDEGKTVVSSTWPSSAAGCYVQLFENLAGVIQNGDEQQVKWMESVSVIELIELAKKSSVEGITLDL